MIPLLPWSAAPYGPFTPLHHHILAHAIPITRENAVWALVAPFSPLGVQAFLLQYRGTRMWRAAIGVLGVLMILRTWMGYRFAGEFGVASEHLWDRSSA
jgi:hypothetical protein